MKLRDKVPQEFMLEFMDTRAAKMLDVDVVAQHGSADDNVRWVGPHRNVYVWWELANGFGVAWNENPGRGWSFPVARVKKNK